MSGRTLTPTLSPRHYCCGWPPPHSPQNLPTNQASVPSVLLVSRDRALSTSRLQPAWDQQYGSSKNIPEVAVELVRTAAFISVGASVCASAANALAAPFNVLGLTGVLATRWRCQQHALFLAIVVPPRSCIARCVRGVGGWAQGADFSDQNVDRRSTIEPTTTLGKHRCTSRDPALSFKAVRG